MASLKLEGPTLGHKHRSFNKLVQEFTANQTRDNLEDNHLKENDIHNLVKIDIAGANRDVHYILEILKGNDMLYITRALKRSSWLMTDDTYAHIMNSEYVHACLIPNMMAKAASKLMLHIRLNLRDEKRVDDFFNYYEPHDLKTALKWLPHCSVAFMNTKVEKYYNDIDPLLLKRLCEKSYQILKVYLKKPIKEFYYQKEYANETFIRKGLQATIFLLNTHWDFYLDVIESIKTQAKYTRRESWRINVNRGNLALEKKYNGKPVFNVKLTKLLMKTYPERIKQNFYHYGNNIHIPTFVKFLGKYKIREFLLSQANDPNQDFGNTWIDFDTVQHFLKRMPREERIDFIRGIFINGCFDREKDSDYVNMNNPEDVENAGMIRLYEYVNYLRCTGDLLDWYECLPLDVVLTEFKRRRHPVYNYRDLRGRFGLLVRAPDRDLKNLEMLLQYYNDNHLNDSKQDKLEFIKNLFYQPMTLCYDSKCWSLLMNIFDTMNLNYQELEGNEFGGIMIKAIIVHEVINKKDVPENLTRQVIRQSTFKEYHKKKTVKEQKMLFDYLYNNLIKEIEQQNVDDQASFENIYIIQQMLTLLNDWQKNLAHYPHVLRKIKKLIKVKRDRDVNDALSWIYNVNKSWRKLLFEESIVWCESERACVNALKHDPSLLSRYEHVVASMRCNDGVSLRQLLTKLRIYWADSIAFEWSQSYREKLSQPLGHKSLMRGLCILLPQRELSVLISEYKPEEANIHWDKNNEILTSLRKHIAQNMHFARPQPTPDDILLYAKGDYLQFALPSLNAILSNLSLVRFTELLPKLLHAPVSLQKHGIRCAFAKMQSEDLRRIFGNHWTTIKNLTIRAVIFKLTYELMCKEKNPSNIENIWRLLTVFIDALTFEEDKTIYELLGDIRNVPLSVIPAYVMRSYKFMKALFPKSDLDKSKYEQTLNYFIFEAEILIDSMEPKFITEIALEYFRTLSTKDNTDEFVPNNLMPLLASFVCYSGTVEIQLQRYETVLLPLMRHSVAVWRSKDKNDILKTNFKQLLSILRQKIKDLVEKDKIVPVVMFDSIEKELEQSLDPNLVYLTLREWKLTVAFAQLVQENKAKVACSADSKTLWADLGKAVAPLFGKICLDFLKEDIREFFPSIEKYFAEALQVVLNDLRLRLTNEEIIVEILKNMLSEELTESIYQKEDPFLELHKTILSHPALEVKMFFYYKYDKYRHRDISIESDSETPNDDTDSVSD